jgi:hypothetical protein
MAENVVITAGVGTTIAADDVAGVKYQQIKLIDGTADSTTPTGVAANPLQVSLANHGANATPVLVDLGAADTLGTVTTVGTVTTITNAVAVTNAGLTALNGAITGTEVQVDVLSMPSTTVTATNLDIRDLTSASDSVAAVCTNAGTFAVQASIAAAQTLSTVTTVGTVSTITGGTITTLSNQTQMGGQNISMGTGARDAGTQRVTIATNDAVPVTFTGSTDVATQTTLAAINTKLTTGTVIGDVNLGATDNAVLDAIAASVASIKGSGAPTVDSYTQAAIVAETGANQPLIAAPGANKQIWVYGGAFTMDVAGTIAFQDEDDTVLSGVMPIGITGGMVLPLCGNFAMPYFKVATNKALEADVVTGTVNGWLNYAIVSV